MVRIDSHADARRDLERETPNGERLLERHVDAAAEERCILGGSRGEKNCELVPAEAGKRLTGAELRGQARAHLL